MMYTQSINKKGASEFLINRMIRIIPLYWLLSFALYILFALIPVMFNSTGITLSWLSASLFFMSQYLLQKMPILYDGWTLEYEMFFYLIFSIGLMSKDIRISFSVCVLIILLLVWFRLSNTIMLEFTYGTACGVIVARWDSCQHTFIIAFAGWAALLLSIFFPVTDYRFLFWGLPAFAIVLSACWMRQIYHPFLKLIGDASYSIYLIQVFTIPAFYKICRLNLFFLPNDILAMLSVATTGIAGVLVYKIIETPVNRTFRSLVRPAPSWIRAT